jgi:hypothetical protein
MQLNKRPAKPIVNRSMLEIIFYRYLLKIRKRKKPTWFTKRAFLIGKNPKNYLIAATFLANFDLMLPALFL